MGSEGAKVKPYLITFLNVDRLRCQITVHAASEDDARTRLFADINETIHILQIEEEE